MSRAASAGAPLLAGLLITIFGWRGLELTPGPGLDPSWRAGLHMAAQGDWVWGRELVFTYGPLGWLRATQFWYTGTGAWALVYFLVSKVALMALLWSAVRRWLGPVWAGLVLLPVAWVVDDPTAAVAFALAVMLVCTGEPRRRSLLLAGVLGLLAGMEMLGKINAGVTIAGVGGIAVLLAPGSRGLIAQRVVIWGASFAAAFVGAWLLAGQPLDAVGDYLHNAARVVSGYSNAMAFSDPARRWTIWLALVVTIAGFYGILKLSDFDRPRVRVAVLALWAGWCFLYFKAGFVRHDPSHDFLFMAAAAAAIPALPIGRGNRLAGVALILIGPLAYSWVTTDPVSDIVAPISNQREARTQLEPLWRPSLAREAERAGRANAVAAQPLPPSVLSAVEGHTVTAIPSELSYVWAYDLDWAPLPVLQGYQAYTTGLDQLNAAALRADDAPERLIYTPGDVVDNRLPSFDTPETARAFLCRYRQVAAGKKVGAFARDENPDRCTRPVLVGSTPVAWGQLVSVPEPPTADSVVFARIAGMAPTRSERVRSLVYKAFERKVVLEPDGRVHRIVSGTVTGGLPLRAGAAADFKPPFNVAVEAQALALFRNGTPAPGPVLRIDFYAFRNPLKAADGG